MATFENELHDVLVDIQKLIIGKNKDYGSKNILNSIVKPELAIAVRLQDKLARLANLVQSGDTPQNESLKDTANDIIGYGIILRMVLDGTFDSPLGDKIEVPF